jgi:PIN domain nuclease of toxin-antitoxin system
MAKQHYLLDTHCWLWWHADPDKLSASTFQLIENGATKIFFSVVSAWEITIKYSLNKLQLPLPPRKYIPSRLELSYMDILPIQLEHTLRVGQLPVHHKDPFDRLLIAQAQAENLIVITHDSHFAKYEIETFY